MVISHLCTFNLPTDHSCSERAGLPHDVNTTSGINHPLYALDMHLTDHGVALTKLIVHRMSVAGKN
jgi:hypothetical protein